MSIAHFSPVDRVEILGLVRDLPELGELPFVSNPISCGFPDPSLDHSEERLDIVRRLVPQPLSTYFAQAQGDSMNKVGILSGAILVVNRALHARPGNIVLAAVSGEFTCKTLFVGDGGIIRLVPESYDPRYRPIEPGEGEEVSIWGVVTAAVNEFRRRRGH